MMGWNVDSMESWLWGGHMIWIAPLLVVAGVLAVAALIWGNQALSGSTGPTPPIAPNARELQSPLEILQSRYARGEINRMQFEEMQRTLTRSGVSGGNAGGNTPQGGDEASKEEIEK